MKPNTGHHLATLCCHAGSGASASAALRSHVTPLYQISVCDFPTIEASLPALAGEGYVYRRHGLPNSDELGAVVAALEGGDAGVATSSGMGALVASVLSLCGAGDRLLVQRDAYGGSQALFDHDLNRFGVEVIYVDAYDLGALDALVRGARAVVVESLSNPLLRRTDIEAIAARCREHGARLIVDNTFATPLGVTPLSLGADLVVHSATKFLGGHHDLCAGVVVGGAELIAPVRELTTRFGLGAAPFDAWLAVRGVRTLGVRMERSWQTCAELLRRLREAAVAEQVYGAEPCALLSFDLGTYARAAAAVAAFELITLTPSLGGVTTTASHPATSSHRSVAPDIRAAAGIGDGLVRISVGLEAVEDVWCDLQRGLDAAARC